MISRTDDYALVSEMIGADVSEILDEPLHICLVEERSGAIFAWRGPGIYEVHVFFSVRGRAALDLCQRMIDTMRESHGARLFWALIPVESRRVIMFARLMGWASRGHLRTRHGINELFILEECPCRH